MGSSANIDRIYIVSMINNAGPAGVEGNIFSPEIGIEPMLVNTQESASASVEVEEFTTMVRSSTVVAKGFERPRCSDGWMRER